MSELKLFQDFTVEQEAKARQWARANWHHGTDINPLWHPIVRDEIRKILAEYPATLQAARERSLAAGVPEAVVNALVKAWPDQAAEILTELAYDSMNGCYHFSRWGMYVGVEVDGYIHT